MIRIEMLTKHRATMTASDIEGALEIMKNCDCDFRLIDLDTRTVVFETKKPGKKTGRKMKTKTDA